MSVTQRTAGEQWADELAAWRIDPAILAAAPESPYGFPPELFRPPAEPADTPSRRRAVEALPAGGSVLDVGCGAGAAGLALAPPAGLVSGVDASEEMLAAFAAAAAARNVRCTTIAGSWPDAAPRSPLADVVVCHNVAYNVTDLGDFARALTRHARRRVVLELTAAHPWVPLGPIWRAVHGQPRPSGPTATLAARVLAEVGLVSHAERWRRPDPWREAPHTQVVAFARRRLCLPAEREAEVAALLDTHHAEGPPTEVVTLWWDGAPR